ncbi:MAG: carboxymuconolactone decarboxylase [Novosphingobium sp.]|nr:carboxymuconolactone decarboxylase [Novosphingobium sp.]
MAELFGTLFPGNPSPEFNAAHTAMAVLAQSPQLALPAAKLSGAVILQSAWGQRANVRELAFQTLGLHFGDTFSTETRRPNAEAAGLTAEHLAAIPDWRNSDLFDNEQRLVIEYAQAVVTGHVPAELFARVAAHYGEQEAVEFTTAIAFWSFWAMIVGATGL